MEALRTIITITSDFETVSKCIPYSLCYTAHSSLLATLAPTWVPSILCFLPVHRPECFHCSSRPRFKDETSAHLWILPGVLRITSRLFNLHNAFSGISLPTNLLPVMHIFPPTPIWRKTYQRQPSTGLSSNRVPSYPTAKVYLRVISKGRWKQQAW